jgi:hypothetical protein
MSNTQMSPVTHAGIRAALRVMIRACHGNTHTHRRTPSLYLYREDGRMIEVFVESGSMHQSEDDTTPLYEITARWHETLDADDVDDACLYEKPFVAAMNRQFGAPNATVSLDVVQENLRSAFRNDHCAARVLEHVRFLLSAELCECGRNIVAPDEMVCLTCIASLQERDVAGHKCGVCHAACHAPIHKTRCCRQWIHIACHRKCGPTCPFCRAREECN